MNIKQIALDCGITVGDFGNQWLVSNEQLQAFAHALIGDSELVEYQRRTKAKWVNYWNAWENCSEGAYDDCKKVPTDADWQYEVRKLYTKPPSLIAKDVECERLRELSTKDQEIADLHVYYLDKLHRFGNPTVGSIYCRVDNIDYQLQVFNIMSTPNGLSVQVGHIEALKVE
jgi:hypothetical protein